MVTAGDRGRSISRTDRRTGPRPVARSIAAPPAWASAGGSGWAILAFELDTGALRTFSSGKHKEVLATSVPLLVLHMYEHGYQMDFGAGVARFLDAFFANVKWDAVNRRFEGAQRASAALRA